MNKNRDKQDVQAKHQLSLVRKQLPDSHASLDVKDVNDIFGRGILLFGVVLCVAGGLFMPEVHVLPSLMIAYGAAILFATQETKYTVLAFVCAFVPAVLSAHNLHVSAFLCAIVLIGLAISLAYMMARSSYSLSKELLVMLAAAILALLIDLTFALLEGYDLSESILNLLTMGITTSQDQTLAVQLEVDSIREYVKLLWPVMYVIDALICGSLARLGAKAGCRRVGVKAQPLNLDSFRLPLGIGVFAIAILMCLVFVNAIQKAWAEQLHFVFVNLFYVLRVPLSLQALGLIGALIHNKNMPQTVLVTTYVVGTFLELSLYVLSVIGLIDMLADFRGLRFATVEKERS